MIGKNSSWYDWLTGNIPRLLLIEEIPRKVFWQTGAVWGVVYLLVAIFGPLLSGKEGPNILLFLASRRIFTRDKSRYRIIGATAEINQGLSYALCKLPL